MNTSEGVLKALYVLALHIAKAKKPFTVTEGLVMTCMKGVFFF
jgi:hypothetical protein